MKSYVKTTVLLLSLLCVTKLIQAEHVESTDTLKNSSDSKAAERKENIFESSTIKSLDKVEKRTENDVKIAENSTQEIEEKIQDDTKTRKEKEDHKLKRKTRSYLSGIKNRYSRTRSQDSSESTAEEEFDTNSDSSKQNENDSEPNISESHTRNEDQTASHEGHKDLLNFLETFLNNSCEFLEPYNNLRDSIEKILNLINESEIDPKLDVNAILSFLFNFKDVWQEYCDSPRETKDSLNFFHNFISKMTEYTSLPTPLRGFKEKLDSALQLSDASAEVMRRSFLPNIISKVISGLTDDQKRSDEKGPSDILTVLAHLIESYGGLLGIPSNILSFIASLIKGLGGAKRSDNALEMLRAIYETYGGVIPDNIKSVLSDLHEIEGGQGDQTTRSDGGPNPLSALLYDDENPSTDSEESGSTRKSEREGPSLEKLLQKYCELRVGSSNIITTLKELLKEFDPKDESDVDKRGITDALKFLKSIKAIVDKHSDVTKRSGFEATFVKGVLDKYCDGLKRSNSALTSFSKVLVPQEGDNTKRSTLLSARPLLDEYIDGSKRSIASLDFIKHFLARYCGFFGHESKRLDSGNKSIDFQKTHTKESTRSKVRTKSNIIHSISEKRRMKRREHDNMIGWRHGVFEPDSDQTVSETQTDKSSPRIIKKVRRLKKPKNLKNRLINLYNGKENGTRTKGHRGQFAKPRIVGLKESPSSSFEVKAGVEKDMGSTESNPRLRCNVRTKASISDAEGRTGSSKGHTFSEIPSNDTKALLCSSETSEVQRPDKNVYIKQSVSGKSIVSYDNPDKYFRSNYSPSKENLEIGTSGFSTLNDTSSKNQSISVVSTDSQNADSISRSETKFVERKDNSRGMESSANVEGSIDAVPNKNPFIMNSRQHSLGMVVENPDKNMESPLPVEKNEKLQTYSKFQRTEDFDINFRRFDPERSRPEIHHRSRSR